MHVLASRPSPRRRLTQLVFYWISSVSSSVCFFDAVNFDTHSRNFILNNARAHWVPSKWGDEILLPAGNKADVTFFELMQEMKQKKYLPNWEFPNANASLAVRGSSSDAP
jgi:hypothetical protein